jgi:hypothetical protein
MKADEHDVEQFTERVTLTVSLEIRTLLKVMRAIKEKEPEIYRDLKQVLIENLEKKVEVKETI